VYEGGFMDNLPNGHGTLTARGNKITGKWQDGVLAQHWVAREGQQHLEVISGDGPDRVVLPLPAPACEG
jgi:hypothetical protein